MKFEKCYDVERMSFRLIMLLVKQYLDPEVDKTSLKLIDRLGKGFTKKNKNKLK